MLTSEGEVIAGTYRRSDLPAGALIGVAVSRGTAIEASRADPEMAQAELANSGDILVTASTTQLVAPVRCSQGIGDGDRNR